MSTHYLGIDMGGTASRWVLVDAAGHLTARGTAPGATGHLFNPASRGDFVSAIAILARAIDAAPIAAAHIGATGLGPRAHADAAHILASALVLDEQTVTLSDDMELAFRAAFAPGAGHLVSAGTGSVGLHVGADGSLVLVGGRGILIDDGGSGTWIALTALDRLYRIIDETGGPGQAHHLAAHLFGAIGGDSWDDVRSFVYGADRGTIGGLARAVASAADAGDRVAQEVLDRAGVELARLGLALVGRAGEKPIGYVGGLLDISPRLKPALTTALDGHEVVFPTIDAALRAAQIARERALQLQDH